MRAQGRPRRAPRLRPDERLAEHVTRHGRFRSLDPSHGRPLPGRARVVAALGWLVFVEEALRRGWKETRGDKESRDYEETWGDHPGS